MMGQDRKAKNHWDEKSKGRNPHPKVIEAFAAAKIDFLTRNIPDLDKMKVLEVGCGDGYISRHLMTLCDLAGVDVSRGMISKNPMKQIAMASAYELPFEDNSFDLAFESNMLHHLDHPEKAILEMKRVSSRYVMITEPNIKSLPVWVAHRFKPDEKGSLIFDLAHLISLLKGAEIEITKAENRGRITPNMTPAFLVPILGLMEKTIPGGFFSIALGRI